MTPHHQHLSRGPTQAEPNRANAPEPTSPRGSGANPYYRLVILNDCDAPQTRMIALVREADTGPEWTYLSADKRLLGSRYLRWHPVAFPKDMTDVEAFGVKPVIEIRDGKYMIRVERTGESRATYRDGLPRKWQGEIGALSTIRARHVAALKQWSKSARTLHSTA